MRDWPELSLDTMARTWAGHSCVSRPVQTQQRQSLLVSVNVSSFCNANCRLTAAHRHNPYNRKTQADRCNRPIIIFEGFLRTFRHWNYS